MGINPVIIIRYGYLFIISLNIPLFFVYIFSRIISFVILYLSLISNVLSSRIDNNYHKRQTFWLVLLIDHLTLWPIWPVSFTIAHIVVIYDLIECTPAEWDFTKCFIMDPVIKHSVFLKPCFILAIMKFISGRNCMKYQLIHCFLNERYTIEYTYILSITVEMDQTH